MAKTSGRHSRIEKIAKDPCAPNDNLTKPQNRAGLSLVCVGDWQVIYEIRNEEPVILVLIIATRG